MKLPLLTHWDPSRTSTWHGLPLPAGAVVKVGLLTGAPGELGVGIVTGGAEGVGAGLPVWGP